MLIINKMLLFVKVFRQSLRPTLTTSTIETLEKLKSNLIEVLNVELDFI